MNPLNSVRGVIVGGFVLAIVIALVTSGVDFNLNSLVIWIHVMAGVTWIGILYYFNFIQVPALGDAAADEGGPGGAGITKYVAPRALWWFRWGAALTWLSGATYLHLQGWLVNALTLGLNGSGNTGLWIGVGAWFGTIMLFNVWVLIWPNQKKILGMVEATADEIASARKVAFIASRVNTLLSIPMLMSMVSMGHAGYFL
jgi:uncharacterized membrane protein